MPAAQLSELMPAVNALYLIALLLVVALAAGLAFRETHRFRRGLREGFGKEPVRDLPDPELVNAFHEYLTEQKEGPAVDAATWNDLNMDAVFCRINACRSSVGEEYLYALLHRPAFDPAVLAQRETRIRYLEQHPEARTELLRRLCILGRLPGNRITQYLKKDLRPASLQKQRLYLLLSVLPFAGVLLAVTLHSWLALAAAGAAVLCNCLIYLRHRFYLEAMTGPIRYTTALLLCAKAISDSGALTDLPLRDGIREAFQPFRKLVRGMRSAYLSAQLSSEFQVMADAFRLATLTDVVRYNRYAAAVMENRESFLRLFELIGELDACASILSYRMRLNGAFCLPEFHGDNRLELTGVFHPLLASPVENDLALAPRVLLTGSNASGKSTFLRAVAVCALLAQTVHTCNARRVRLKPVLVVTSMALQDSLLAGESLYMAEIRSLRRMLELVGHFPCLCCIDELLKGTNADERRAASRAILERLSESGCLCIAATHDTALARRFAPQYDNYHFSEAVTPGQTVTFDYKLRAGVCKDRNAIRMLEALRVDPAVCEAAKRYLEEGMSDHGTRL